jgi:hypothetical protein
MKRCGWCGEWHSLKEMAPHPRSYGFWVCSGCATILDGMPELSVDHRHGRPLTPAGSQEERDDAG